MRKDDEKEETSTGLCLSQSMPMYGMGSVITAPFFFFVFLALQTIRPSSHSHSWVAQQTWLFWEADFFIPQGLVQLYHSLKLGPCIRWHQSRRGCSRDRRQDRRQGSVAQTRPRLATVRWQWQRSWGLLRRRDSVV